MEHIIANCDLLLSELSKFNDNIIYRGPSIDDNRIELFEKDFALILPFDFKYILKRYNGFSLEGVEVYGFDTTLRGASLDEVYKFEHFQISNKMPAEFFPFSPDGRGNHYCLNLNKLNKGQCPVVFWQHDLYYSSIDEVEECYKDFISWINKEMIEWTLQDYNYDGTEK